MSGLRLLAGLGNPGREYEQTRHNLGFLVVEELARRQGWPWQPSRFCRGVTAEGALDGVPCCLLKPLTYMNHSGAAVKALATAKAVSPGDILVVCDDFHLDFSAMRLRTKGSDGGHHGLASVIAACESDQIPRLRLGIGAPRTGSGSKTRDDVVDYVLEEFSRQEKDRLGEFVAAAADCCAAWLSEDADQVMNRYNQRS